MILKIFSYVAATAIGAFIGVACMSLCVISGRNSDSETNYDICDK